MSIARAERENLQEPNFECNLVLNRKMLGLQREVSCRAVFESQQTFVIEIRYLTPANAGSLLLLAFSHRVLLQARALLCGPHST